MDRRKLLAAGVGIYAGGAITGGAVMLAAGGSALVGAQQASDALSPTARTAAPSGARAYLASVTFRTAPPVRVVALTLDDGPTATWTPRVLEMLRYHRAKATFFRVGQRASQLPDLVHQTAAEGHEQGNHTWAHDDLTQHDEVFDVTTLRRTGDLLAKLTSRPQTLCRPPYGRIDTIGLAACALLRYDVILWSAHVTGSNPRGDVDSILRGVTPGTIILAHDGGSEPNDLLIAELSRLLGALTSTGYQFVTISELRGLVAPPSLFSVTCSLRIPQ